MTQRIVGETTTTGDGCTNGCTCDRDLMQLADELKRQFNADELRRLVELLAGG